MTDLLGVCLSWGEGGCVVAPESGDPVTIRLADIVSGKPVPPRASPRLRVGAREAQVRGTALFPLLHTAPLAPAADPGLAESWLLRWSPAYAARRANSVLAFPGGAYDVSDVARVVTHYQGLGQPSIAAVLAESAERELFAGLGWVPESHEADTHFQVASVASASRALRGVPSDDVVVTVDDGMAEAVVPGRARGWAAYVDDWVGFRGIEVEPHARRQGLARAVMAALVAWGAERGATTAYLQVLGDNAPALDLYAGMGFADHHTYAYLTPPGPAFGSGQAGHRVG